MATTAQDQQDNAALVAEDSRDSKKAAPKDFRPDIQALRAVAVMAVVFNHLWPTRLTGGYVGVDVFFVISGFLISSHLGREIARSGRIKLTKFYARRIRRLLPAAFLVLFLSLVAAYFLLPFPRWESTAHEVFASAFYVENWLLAIQSVEYSALNASASLAQHYWSLSVEEQFYLFWPLIMLFLFKIRQRRAQIIGIAFIGVLSLAFSVFFTEASKSQAYFVTPTRVWEFAIGALIALGGAKFVLPKVASGVASLLGLLMIFGSVLLFNHQTEFPGYLALIPTVGTGLVIISGLHPGRQWHSLLSSSRPVQFLGNISYSLYLWHWPLIVLAPFVLSDMLNQGRLTSLQRVGILALAVILAYLSKIVVEDRRDWPPLAKSTKATFIAMVAGMAAIALVASGLNWTYDRHVVQAEKDALTAAIQPCHGAAALIPGSGCVNPYGPANTVDMGPGNAYYPVPQECAELDTYLADASTKTTRVCDFSEGNPSAKIVWLVGDSHGQQWQGPLIDLARANKWVVKLSFLAACPFAGIQFLGFKGDTSTRIANRCTAWTSTMADVVAKDRPAYVFTSFYAREERAEDHSGRPQAEQYRDGLENYWQKWTGAGAQVFVLSDPPLNGDVRPIDCVALNRQDPAACAVARIQAQPSDPLATVAKTSHNPKVKSLDFTDYFCDPAKCYGVVGNVVVYYDADHMNLEFSRSLGPIIAKEMGLSRR